MKKAIITGSTGLVGSAVAKYLVKKGIDVLCLGRYTLNNSEIKNNFGSENINYLAIKMEDILALSDEIMKINWELGDSCVFYNFAWGGRNRLTDGEFKDQFINATYSSNAVLSAKKLGCEKFVNIGTIEETFAEVFLKDTDENKSYNSTQSDYAISKLASRDMCKMLSYLEKIDYIHTRLSVPLDSSLSKGGYISSVLAKIKEGKSYEKPKNSQLFDIVLLEDVVKAYYLVGQKGKNKADYYIGTANPKTLGQYFELFENYKNGKYYKEEEDDSFKLDSDIFSIKDLVNDTGFSLSFSFEDFIKTII